MRNGTGSGLMLRFRGPDKGVTGRLAGPAKGGGMKAWYFSQNDCKLQYGDGRTIKAGVTHTVACEPILCKQGLHGSVKPLDALEYAPGGMVWRVDLGGDMVIGDDKIAATERKYLWGYDATPILRKFARLCALDVIDMWDAPDVVIQYLKTGNDDLRVVARAAERDARAAAWTDARAADRAAWAAWDAWWDAALTTAWDAWWDAARAAVWAAWAVAWDAARAAARADVRAARDAAWAIAREKQNNRLYWMILGGRNGNNNDTA